LRDPKTILGVVLAAVLLCALTLGLTTRSEPKPIVLTDPERVILQTEHLLDLAGGTRCGAGCPQDLDAWTVEMLPWFAEEGVASQPVRPVVMWTVFEGEDANHVLGRADCEKQVWMNVRYLNPASPWYQELSFVATLAHELAHIQQGTEVCRGKPLERVEATAQVVSFEVLAAMALNGNKWAAIALLEEIQGLAIGEMRYRALGDERKMRHLDRLLERIDDAGERAERAQRARYWERKPARRKEILEAYVHLPYMMLVRGLETGTVGGLALPPSFSLTMFRPYVPELRLDDLAYFLAHADELFARP
jgi:hypothetical protein